MIPDSVRALVMMFCMVPREKRTELGEEAPGWEAMSAIAALSYGEKV